MTLKQKTSNLYVVGDSTVSSFKDSYFYPRYGYGTQLKEFFTLNLHIHNLAMSGRSSKSFITEKNYDILKESLQADDFLLIGFGHNDEKSEDCARFTDATKSMDDPDSFAYYLNTYYIEFALKRGATPILCTPIVRLNEKDDYAKEAAHKTKTGDYAAAILQLGQVKNVQVIDLRKMTMEEYQQIGYEEAKLYHAILLGLKDRKSPLLLPNFSTVDQTHLNLYGAKFVAYLIAKEIKESNSPLSFYLKSNIKRPSKEETLLPNPNYVFKEYVCPNLVAYQPKAQFKTLSENWYGTAFGDCDQHPNALEAGFIAKEIQTSMFYVGQYGDDLNGKLSLSTDGLAFLFQQIHISYNFEMTAKAKVLKCHTTKQSGFGLMLRDDCYLNQTTQKDLILSNYLAAGFLTGEEITKILFRRENSNLIIEDTILPMYKEGDTAELKIIRIGQSITLEVLYKGKKYIKTFYDFDLLAVDPSYMYVGMFATKGTLVEFSSVDLKFLGKSQGA